jgi:hypothetical protein
LTQLTLTSATLDLTIAVVLSSASDGDAPAAIGPPTHGRGSRWAPFWRRHGPRPADNPDHVVALWKAAWLNGANARWKAVPSEANPHANGQERRAWDAGWRWAEQNPDRRSHRVSRLAHRRRRASDSTPHLTRALGLSALGVTVFLISRALHRWGKRTSQQS